MNIDLVKKYLKVDVYDSIFIGKERKLMLGSARLLLHLIKDYKVSNEIDQNIESCLSTQGTFFYNNVYYIKKDANFYKLNEREQLITFFTDVFYFLTDVQLIVRKNTIKKLLGEATLFSQNLKLYRKFKLPYALKHRNSLFKFLMARNTYIDDFLPHYINPMALQFYKDNFLQHEFVKTIKCEETYFGKQISLEQLYIHTKEFEIDDRIKRYILCFDFNNKLITSLKTKREVKKQIELINTLSCS